MVEIVRSEIDPQTHRETIVLRNAHGAQMHVSVRVGAFDHRQAEIKKATARLEDLEAEIDAHVKATGATVRVPALEDARQRAESERFD